VNVPFQKELDAATKGKVVPALMRERLVVPDGRVLTVLAGGAYWEWASLMSMQERRRLLRHVMLSFIVIWTCVGVSTLSSSPGKARWTGSCDRRDLHHRSDRRVVAFSSNEHQGWQAIVLLRIGIGGGIGWVHDAERLGRDLAHSEKLISGLDKDNAQNGTPSRSSQGMARMDSGLARECIPEPAHAVFMGARATTRCLGIRFSRRKGQNTLTAKNAKTSAKFAKKELDLLAKLRDCFAFFG